jgi:uncharacterized membrane protein
LQAFDEIIENGAERVFQQFELEGAHRRRMENLATRWQAIDLVIGKIFAFVFVIGALLVSAFAISEGHALAGSFLGGGVLASVVTAFIYQKRNG